MRNFRLDDESGHQEALFSWAAYRTGLMPELQYMDKKKAGNSEGTAGSRQADKAYNESYRYC